MSGDERKLNYTVDFQIKGTQEAISFTGELDGYYTTSSLENVNIIYVFEQKSHI